jgi:hypothetical protein
MANPVETADDTEMLASAERQWREKRPSRAEADGVIEQTRKTIAESRGLLDRAKSPYLMIPEKAKSPR